MGEKSKIFKLDEIEWIKLVNDHNGQVLFDKRLVNDSKTGMQVNISKYPAGYMTTWHTHSHAHGMYVIEGRLKTNLGIVEPGNFVWFPEGEVMEHGATDEEDCTVVFITNAPFQITYREEDSK